MLFSIPKFIIVDINPILEASMSETLKSISIILKDIVDKLEEQQSSYGGGYFGDSVSGSAYITRHDLVEGLNELRNIVDGCNALDFGVHKEKIEDYVVRLERVRDYIVPNLVNNSGLQQVLSAYFITMDGLRGVLDSVLDLSNPGRVREISKKLSILESRLEELGPRLEGVGDKVLVIESAYDAADKLPENLNSLRIARKDVGSILDGVKTDQEKIKEYKRDSEDIFERLRLIDERAADVLSRCESVYSAATSVGLAAAFDERSKLLSKSMWCWVLGLFASLCAGWWLGGDKIHSLLGVVNSKDPSVFVIFVNILFSVMSIGAPIWFAWLATKQIGQRFRLAEDYAFKASISRAYEGYRREAARIGGSDMEEKLLASALTRLDELPLRLVETPSYGSPLHEFFSSGVVKKAFETVPGFSGQVMDLARGALHLVTSPKSVSTKRTQPSSKDMKPGSVDHEDSE